MTWLFDNEAQIILWYATHLLNHTQNKGPVAEEGGNNDTNKLDQTFGNILSLISESVWNNVNDSFIRFREIFYWKIFPCKFTPLTFWTLFESGKTSGKLLRLNCVRRSVFSLFQFVSYESFVNSSTSFVMKSVRSVSKTLSSGWQIIRHPIVVDCGTQMNINSIGNGTPFPIQWQSHLNWSLN